MSKVIKSGIMMAILAQAALFAFMACEDDDPADPADALIGSWQFTSSVVYFGSSVADADSSFEDNDNSGGTSVLTFNANGSGGDVYTDTDGSSHGNDWTFTATSDEITLTSSENGEVLIFSYEISDNTLSIIGHEEASAEEPEKWYVQKWTKL